MSLPLIPLEHLHCHMLHVSKINLYSILPAFESHSHVLVASRNCSILEEQLSHTAREAQDFSRTGRSNGFLSPSMANLCIEEVGFLASVQHHGGIVTKHPKRLSGPRLDRNRSDTELAWLRGGRRYLLRSMQIATLVSVGKAFLMA